MEKTQKPNTSSSSPRILYVKAVGASVTEVKEIGKSLSKFGKEHNIEFLVSNDSMELMSARELLKELYELVKSSEAKEE